MCNQIITSVITDEIILSIASNILMGRRSKAQSLIEELEDIQEKVEPFIIVYDFRGFKPSKRFWENLKRISEEKPDTGLIQYSVYFASSLSEAILIARLAESYGAEALIFSVKEYVKQEYRP